jgi:hypothetical protein
MKSVKTMVIEVKSKYLFDKKIKEFFYNVDLSNNPFVYTYKALSVTSCVKPLKA